MDRAAHVDVVGLRALVPQGDLQLLERWLRSPHVVRWWGTPELHLAALGQRSRDSHAVITVDGRPVGYLCWQRPPPEELEAAGLTDLPEDLVDIDILIGEPELLGRGVGSRALALLVEELHGRGVGFAGLGTSTSNGVAIRAYEKAGFHLFRDFEDPESGPCKYLVVRLNEAAFENEPEADVVDELRSGCDTCLSFVAVDQGAVVGHILFTPATLDNGGPTGMGLAPNRPGTSSVLPALRFRAGVALRSQQPMGRRSR
jgi:aminoglycoside 6'-N-acetyltransferase